jgi:hypothetical protein
MISFLDILCLVNENFQTLESHGETTLNRTQNVNPCEEVLKPMLMSGIIYLCSHSCGYRSVRPSAPLKVAYPAENNRKF